MPGNLEVINTRNDLIVYARIRYDARHIRAAVDPGIRLP